jgi:hypothetical protein
MAHPEVLTKKLKLRNNDDKSISVVYLLSIPCLNTIYSHPFYCILKNRIQDTLQRYQTECAIRFAQMASLLLKIFI